MGRCFLRCFQRSWNQLQNYLVSKEVVSEFQILLYVLGLYYGHQKSFLSVCQLVCLCWSVDNMHYYFSCWIKNYYRFGLFRYEAILKAYCSSSNLRLFPKDISPVMHRRLLIGLLLNAPVIRRRLLFWIVSSFSRLVVFALPSMIAPYSILDLISVLYTLWRILFWASHLLFASSLIILVVLEVFVFKNEKCLFQFRFLSKIIPRILMSLTMGIITLLSFISGLGAFFVLLEKTMHLDLIGENLKPFILLQSFMISTLRWTFSKMDLLFLPLQCKLISSANFNLLNHF